MEELQDKEVAILFRLPKATRDEFKLQCVQDGTTMTGFLKQCISEYTKDEF